MPQNPHTDTSGNPNVVADVDTVSASNTNDLRETARWLRWPIELKQKFIPQLVPANSEYNNMFKQEIQRGTWDIKGQRPLSVGNELFFVSNTAQFAAALKYGTNAINHSSTRKRIMGVGNPVIIGDHAKLIPSGTLIDGCVFASPMDFTFSLGAGADGGSGVARFTTVDMRNIAKREGDFIFFRSASFSDGLSNLRWIIDPQCSNPIQVTVNGSLSLSSGDLTQCFYMKKDVRFLNCVFLDTVNIRNTYNMTFTECDFVADEDGESAVIVIPFDDNVNYSDIFFPYFETCRFSILKNTGLDNAMVRFGGAILGCVMEACSGINGSGVDLNGVGADILTFGAGADAARSSIMTSCIWGSDVARMNPKINVPVAATPIAGNAPNKTFLIWHKHNTPGPTFWDQNIWNGVSA